MASTVSGRGRIPAGTDANPRVGGKGKRNVKGGKMHTRKYGRHGKRGKR